MHNTVQTHYDLQYLTMHLSGYMNASPEPDLLAIKHEMEYLMHHPHESIMYPQKKIYKPLKYHIKLSSKQGMHKLKNQE